jgi:CheY-like chemotaxis protein
MAKRILIIDDRPEVARAMARALRDYETSTETDPRCAVRRVADGERFDIVLCDLVMPEMTGGEVYDAFRRERAAPVMLMMSGEANVASLYATGCPVLIKPISATQLRTLVSDILHDEHANLE